MALKKIDGGKAGKAGGGKKGKEPPAQTEVPGTERVVHSDITKKADQLYSVRAERMELSEEEGKLAAELLALMKKHGETTYTEGDMTVTVVAVDERVRVKKKSAE